MTSSNGLNKAEMACCADTSGWAKFDGGSEKGSRYTVIDKATTFYGAQERCQKLGGYVVHINSLREQLFIEDFLTQLLERRRDGRNRDDVTRSFCMLRHVAYQCVCCDLPRRSAGQFALHFRRKASREMTQDAACCAHVRYISI